MALCNDERSLVHSFDAYLLLCDTPVLHTDGRPVPLYRVFKFNVHDALASETVSEPVSYILSVQTTDTTSTSIR